MVFQSAMHPPISPFCLFIFFSSFSFLFSFFLYLYRCSLWSPTMLKPIFGSVSKCFLFRDKYPLFFFCSFQLLIRTFKDLTFAIKYKEWVNLLKEMPRNITQRPKTTEEIRSRWRLSHQGRESVTKN